MAGLLMVVLVLAAVGTFSVMHTALDTKATTHYDTGNRAFYAAESGLMHALAQINRPGVINFKADVVDRWAQYLGNSQITMPSDAKSSYALTVAADPTNPSTKGTITAVGRGPLLARRTVQISLTKGDFTGVPGALHLAADNNVAVQFAGNAFEINGNNHNRFGTQQNDGKAIPGISTRNQDNANTVINALNNNQRDNVKGLGFSTSPLTPAVKAVGGPGIDDIDQFIADLLTNPTVVTTNAANVNGNQTFGTVSSPQVTHMTNSNVRLNGSAQGAGILIVDGSITINGGLNFIGLILVRGNTIIDQDPLSTILLGNATIRGSLWTGSLQVRVGGSAILDYCYECLQLVDSIGGQTGLVPRPMTVSSWGEVL